MITYIPESSSSRYTALFEKATAALNVDPITTLEEYFAHIKELSILDTKYTILPLDEEVFEINANTRAITVPPTFKKHGVGVQGDQLAEIVYFKIDRFFDAQDLNETEIYIQWETAPDSKGIVNKGLSKEYVRDIESEAGKIIFGWGLSRAITENPGNVKFSVRFYNWLDEEKTNLAYSFSTLTSSVLVNPGLDFDLTEGAEYVEDITDIVLQRLTNSEVVGGEDVKLPEFVLNLIEKQDLDANLGVTVLKAQAWSPDAGLISYLWEMRKDGVLKEIADVPLFEVTKDTTPAVNKIYYEQTNEEEYPLGYKAFDWTEDETDIPTLYEKFATFTADKTGSYNVIATNTKGHKGEEKSSVICVIPTPMLPIIKTEPVASGILREDADGVIEPVVLSVEVESQDNGALSYQWWNGGAEIEGANAPSYSAVEPGYYYVVVSNTLNKDIVSCSSVPALGSRITFPAAEPIVLNTKVEGLVTGDTLVIILDNSVNSDGYKYQWYKSAGGDDDLSNDKKILGATESTYKTEEDGNFYAMITNTWNGTEATVQSKVYIVEEPAV